MWVTGEAQICQAGVHPLCVATFPCAHHGDVMQPIYFTLNTITMRSRPLPAKNWDRRCSCAPTPHRMLAPGPSEFATQSKSRPRYGDDDRRRFLGSRSLALNPGPILAVTKL
jgi:hypothetical protein